MFDIQVEDHGIARLAGRLDAAESERALKVLKGIEASLTLDCSKLDYISSAGLGALMQASKQSRGGGTKLAVAALRPVVLEIFQISRFDKLLPCHPTVDAALAAVRPGNAG